MNFVSHIAESIYLLTLNSFPIFFCFLPLPSKTFYPPILIGFGEDSTPPFKKVAQLVWGFIWKVIFTFLTGRLSERNTRRKKDFRTVFSRADYHR